MTRKLEFRIRWRHHHTNTCELRNAMYDVVDFKDYKLTSTQLAKSLLLPHSNVQPLSPSEIHLFTHRRASEFNTC